MARVQKATICLDFDGVINSYSSGYSPDSDVTFLPDAPTDGAKEAVAKLRERFFVMVYSTRCGSEGGREAIEKWLAEHDIVVDRVCESKPAAVMYVDDRAVRFDGDWDATLERVMSFSHWILGRGWSDGLGWEDF